MVPRSDGSLHNDLLAGEGGIVAPSRPPHSCHGECARVPGWSTSFVTALDKIQSHMDQLPGLRQQFDDYLTRFGDRCFEELKLESPTLFDDPLPLLRSIGRAVRGLGSGVRSQGPGVRSQAEDRVRQAIRFRPLRRLLFRWLLRNARARVRDRENLRFERTRLFARARQIFLEFGRRLHAMGFLDDDRDVFFLEVNEILGFLEGTSTLTNLRGLTQLRKQEFADYRKMAAPPARFETHGAVHQTTAFHGSSQVESSIGEERRGLGCCAGIVRGSVRVITDPRGAVLAPGENSSQNGRSRLDHASPPPPGLLSSGALAVALGHRREVRFPR